MAPIGHDAWKHRVTVIVPVYEDWHDAMGLIEALKAQTLNQDLWTAVFVDNGSEVLPERSSLPGFVNLTTCTTPGSYAARNEGLKAASSEYLVFTDADCRPDPQWLEQMLVRLDSDDSPDLVAGDVIVGKLDQGEPNVYELYDIALGLPQKRYVSRGYAVTANLAVRRDVFDGVGVFDARRFSGGDAEFCRRAGFAGYKLVFAPDAAVHHPARSEWRQLERKARRVKGGQLLNGPRMRRAMFCIRTFLPPVFAFLFALQCRRISKFRRFQVCAVQSRLWLTEMSEVLRLFLGATPERR